MPFRMQPGLERLPDGARQLTPARPDSPHLAARLAVLRERWATALMQVDGFDAGPALAALRAQAARDAPGLLHAESPTDVSAPMLGWAVHGDRVLPCPGASPARGATREVGPVLDTLPPAWRAPALHALAVEEDLAIVEAAGSTVPWLAVALPSHWAPADKLGRPFTQVHAPVADNALLLAAGAALMKLVTGPQRWARHVWTLTPHAQLAAHPQHGRPGPGWPAPGSADDDAVAALACWRTERQTFIPVPAAGQAVFTIHVQVRPLADAVDSTERCLRLADGLASMSDAVLAYRNLAAVRDPLVRWLRQRASDLA